MPCRRVMRAAGQRAIAARLFSALFAAALAQPTNEPSDHKRGQQERDDHAHADEHIGQNDSGAVLDGHGARRRSASNASARSVEQIASLAHADRLGPRFRLPSVNRRHPSAVGMGAFFCAFVPAAKALSGAYEGGIAGMLTIIKASLLASALMLLESCTGYLTSYQTPCVEGHICECVRYTTINRSWLDCRDYGRVKSRVY